MGFQEGLCVLSLEILPDSFLQDSWLAWGCTLSFAVPTALVGCWPGTGGKQKDCGLQHSLSALGSTTKQRLALGGCAGRDLHDQEGWRQHVRAEQGRWGLGIWEGIPINS